MPQGPADFTIDQHTLVTVWNSLHFYGLSAKIVLDYEIAEEVVEVVRNDSKLTICFVVPKADQTVELLWNDGSGRKMSRDSVGGALAKVMVEERAQGRTV